MQDPFALAMTLSVRIEYTDLTHLGRDGDSDPRTRTIRLQEGMLDRLERSVLAHELIHIIHGDLKTKFGHYDDRDERRADEQAAHLLIDIEEYRIAEEKCGNHVEGIALDLNVMDWIVEAFERTLCRIGDLVYVNPRHGVGNWDAKIRAVA